MQHNNTTSTLAGATIIRSILVAVLTATVALILFVLPAEYNIDITGFGRATGLTNISNQTATAIAGPASEKYITGKAIKDIKEIVVPPLGGIEFKVLMTQYDRLNYQWVTVGDSLYFDLHGEPEGNTTGHFESYAISTAQEMKGSFIAPFDGTHGWYWKNLGTQPQIVKLVIEGQYQPLNQ